MEDVLALENTSILTNECITKSEKLVQEISDIAAQNERKPQFDLDSTIDKEFSASPANTKPRNNQYQGKNLFTTYGGKKKAFFTKKTNCSNKCYP